MIPENDISKKYEEEIKEHFKDRKVVYGREAQEYCIQLMQRDGLLKLKEDISDEDE